MRGKLVAAVHRTTAVRITPAGAGKTLSHTNNLGQPEDHPRRCGENRGREKLCKLGTGSPPQVRGKQNHQNPAPLQQRITPADAGKTLRVRAPPPPRPDHPRGCGENTDSGRICCGYCGSPPRMRGKQNGKKKRTRLRGITPADAGKTTVHANGKISFWDHPRGCGENSADSSVMRSSDGSPPQVRGKQPRKGRSCRIRRITPAGAGKTSSDCTPRSNP